VVNPGFLLHWRARQGLAKSFQNYVLYVDTIQLTYIKTFVLQYKGITILRCGCSRTTRGLELMLCSLCGVEADQLCICFVCVSLHMLTLLCTLVCPPYFVVEPLNQEVGCYSVFFYFSRL